MKIVIDARTLGSKPSGIGIYVFNYIKEIMKTDHELILLTDVSISQEMAYLNQMGIKIISYGISVYRSAQVLKYFGFVRRQLSLIQPELFWEPNILIPTTLSGYSGKVLITIHDMFPVTHMQYFGWKYGQYFRYILRKTIKIADIILYDSIETKVEAENFCKLLLKKKTFVQYVIVPKIDKNEKTVKTANTKNVKEKDYFLYVGNMEKRKGVDLLLDAYDSYRNKGGKRSLVLAGKSREKDIDKKIKYIVDKFEDVTYCGYVDENEKQYLYQNCTCFLFPSMAEGFGICVLEAMNYYKPIIASNLSIFKEIVGDSVSYFSLNGNRLDQLDSLSQKMLEPNLIINKDKYDNVMEQYLPEKLGKSIVEILERN